jgi:hypothetical protein
MMEVLMAALAGHTILIVEDERGPFAQQLQAALERVGAETILAPTPARARDHASRFDFSVAAIYADGVVRSVELRRLLKELGSMPVLLYGAEAPPYGWFRDARFLVTSDPSHTGAIVEAVTRLLSLSVPSPARPSTLSFLDRTLMVGRFPTHASPTGSLRGHSRRLRRQR